MKTLRDVMIEAVAALSDEEVEALWSLAGARRVDEGAFLEELKEHPYRDSFEERLLREQEILVRVVTKLDEAGERWHAGVDEMPPTHEQSPTLQLDVKIVDAE